MNIYDYFKEKLGVEPDDTSLKKLPVDSGCGDDCKEAIDAAEKLVAIVAKAVGHSTETDMIISATEEAVTVFWRG